MQQLMLWRLSAQRQSNTQQPALQTNAGQASAVSCSMLVCECIRTKPCHAEPHAEPNTHHITMSFAICMAMHRADRLAIIGAYMPQGKPDLCCLSPLLCPPNTFVCCHPRYRVCAFNQSAAAGVDNQHPTPTPISVCKRVWASRPRREAQLQCA